MSKPVPTEVWVVVMEDREGNPRGVEKIAGGCFYMTEGEAWDARAAIEDPVIKWSKTVHLAEITIL